MKLHLGCGDRYLPGFIHIDIELNKHFFLNYLHDVTELPMFKDNSVDEIYVSHVLDHFSRNEQLDRTLSEWYRVLKPGGVLRVAVSDFEAVVHMYTQGMDLEDLWGLLIGGHKSQYDKHGCIFDYKVLKRYFEKHGFKNIHRYKWQDVMPEDFDDLSMAYLPHMDKEKGYLMSLNVEATK